MVIVHLSTTQRRIIAPQKTETLGEVFKRFCAEFGYNESEYEFQAFPADERIFLDMNLSASIVKEVQLVPKSNYSRRDSQDSYYSIIRDASPPPVTMRKDIFVSNPPPATNNISIQQPKSVKRTAPKPPVTVNNSSCDTITIADESIMPDIDIPPPPDFLPNQNEKSETLFKSVECSTEFMSPELDEYHHSSDYERVREDRDIHLSDTDNSFDSREDIIAIDNEVESNKAVAIVKSSDENAQKTGSNSCSSVEDVDEDEHLLNLVRQRRDKPDDDSHMKQRQEVVDKQTEKKPVETSDIGGILPIQSSEEMSVPSTDHKRHSNDIQKPIFHQELPETTQLSLKHSEKEKEEEHSVSLKDHKVLEASVLINRVDIESPQISLVSSEQVTDIRNIRVESDCKSNESEPKDSQNLHSKPDEEITNNDLSFPDGPLAPIDHHAILIRSPTPKHYWEPHKQRKTLEFLSHSLNTVGSSEEKPVETKSPNSADNQTPNSATPIASARTVKQVQVTVEEPPIDNSGRPTYRPRQAKKLFFTAG